ncbi:hypothetical protein N566_13820, partial [Streptomycetaceae bacterium MP113-05]
VLRGATLIGVIHETFVERVAAMGVPRDRVRLVPNWSHVAAPTTPRHDTRRRLGWAEDRTVVLHSGNMGLKQGLEVLTDAARQAPDVLFVLMGDGNQRDLLRTRAAGLPNVEFRPPADAADFADVLAAADVLAVTQRASVLDMSVPSKLTSYFVAGRPVVASVASGGGTAEEVRRSGAGELVPPEDPAALLRAVRAFAADPAGAEAMGAQGPAYVSTRLTCAEGLGRMTDMLDEALTGTRRRAAGAREKGALL